MVMALARRLAASVVICLLVAGPAAAREPSPAPGPALEHADLSKVIEMLEDDQQRARVLNLLKLMAASEAEVQAGPPPSAAEVWEEAILDLAGSAWHGLEVSGTGLNQALNHASVVLKALFTPRALELWPPHFLPVFSWSLVCLVAAWFTGRRWGRLPAAGGTPGLPARLKLLLSHFLAVAGPNLVLIVSLSFWPELSSTAPGVTANLALGFILLQTLVRHLLINCSILHIALKTASALLAPLGDGPTTLSGLPAALAPRIMGAWRFFAVYLTALAFVKEVFLDLFVLGWAHAAILLVLVLPGVLVLTVKLWRLRGQVEAAVGGLEAESPAEGRPVYLTDKFFKKCGAFLSIGVLWLAAWAYLGEAPGFFLGRLLGSLAVIGLALGAIRAVRFLFTSLVKPVPSDEDGRRLLVNLDLLVGLVVSLAAFGVILTIWGLPWGRLLENSLAREILARGLVIALTGAILVIFLKFSRLAAEWLLAVPALKGNRNWRTMAPLGLTLARALGIFLAGVVILERLGVNVGPILAGAGILGLGVGLGAQTLVKDLINGISILGMDIIAVGDYVTIGGHSGTVEKVGLRSIRLRDNWYNLIMIPTSSIDTIVNKTRDLSTSLLEIVMPSDVDPDKLLALARSVAEDFNADAEWRPCLAEPVTVVGVIGFDPGGTTIRLKLTAPAGKHWEPECELRRRLKQRLLQAGHDSRAYAQTVVNIIQDYK